MGQASWETQPSGLELEGLAQEHWVLWSLNPGPWSRTEGWALGQGSRYARHAITRVARVLGKGLARCARVFLSP